MVVQWNEMKILQKVLDNKLIFIETQNELDTMVALDNYKKACDNGRGAILFCVSRGKLAQGVQFTEHYSRCVVVFGVPYHTTLSRNLKARLAFLESDCGISETDYLNFDAVRYASQCVGRILLNKSDYGMIILADKRFARPEKMTNLPKLIRHHIEDGSDNLSVDQALLSATDFFKNMGQPFEIPESLLLD